MIAVPALLAGALVSVGTLTAVPTAAEAVPGNPGTPSAPTLIFEEDFQNRPAPEPIVRLTDYVGATGQTYTADQPWLENCNGWIASHDQPSSAAAPLADCMGQNSWDESRRLARGLGVLDGLSSDEATSNFAVTAYTSGNPGANFVEFETATNIPLPLSDRFITFGVDVAAVNCVVSSPQLQFSLLNDAGSAQPIGSVIDTCESGRVLTEPGVGNIRAGSYTPDTGILFSGNSVGIRMTNQNASGSGNDHAFDNIRIFDVSPQLDKSFSPESVPVGGVSTLTLTVTNTDELGAKNGWAFTDTLPDGLVIADPAAIGGSCTADVSAPQGGSAIDVTNGVLNAGDASCTITLNVTSSSPAGGEASPVVYENCAANISNQIGINDPECATVEFFSDAALSIEKTSDATANSRVGDTVNYTVVATNTGTGDYTAENPAVVFDDLSGVIDDAGYNNDAQASMPGNVSYQEPLLSWIGALPVGESVEISYTVTLQAGGDGTVRNVAWAPEDTDNEEPPVCNPPVDGVDPETGEACDFTQFELPRLSITKTADRTELPAIGESVEYTVTVTSEGPGDYTDDAPATFTDDLSDVIDAADFNNDANASVGEVSYDEPTLSWEGALAAGESATVTYTVTYNGEGDQNLRNFACIPADDVVPGAAACDFITIPGADLTQWKQVESSDTPAVAGSVLTYTLFFKSDGETAATVDAIDDLTHVTDDADVTVEPEATNGLTATRDGNRIAITGEVAAGETASVTYQVTVRADGERGDDAAANFLLQNDPNETPPPPPAPVCEPTDEQLPDCTYTPIASVSYAKSVEASENPISAGTVLTYTVLVENTGAVTAPVSRDDVLTDVLDDADLTSDPVSDTESVTVSAVSNNRFSIGGQIAAGETATITYEVTVKSEADRGNNSADNFLVPPGGTPGEDPCVEGSEECTVTPLPLVEVEKSADPATGSSVEAGQEITYTLTFRNSGKATGSVDYTDNLAGVLDDADLSSAPAASDAALSASDGADGLVRVTGSLSVDQVVTVSYTVTVKADGERGDNILRNVVAKTGNDDAACGDDGVSCTEHPIGEIDDWKTVDPASGSSVRAGAELTYTLHFENTGKADKEFTREDVLTQVLDDADVTAQPVASDAALTVSDIADGRFQISGTLVPGQTATVTYKVTVKADGERGDDRLGNFLVSPGEVPPENCEPADGDRPDCTINHVNDVSVVKSSNPESGTEVKAGQEVTYTLTFKNSSANADAAPVEIDYTDHMVDVLDDATLTSGPQTSNDDLQAVAEGDVIRITGSVPTGATYTVAYTVKVNANVGDGNRHLGNVVAVTGEKPICAEDSPLCTSHEIPEVPPLPVTGAAISAYAITAGLGLLLIGGFLLAASRRRKSALSTASQDVNINDLI